ncbi:MAG: M48 family metallopeptidase [Bryobacterales bacterium]|nr:M48 family metallopeptidase [Bryobacterales bacterium]
MRAFVYPLLAVLSLGGCAGIRMQIPQMNPLTESAMEQRFQQGIPPSLNVPVGQRRDFARRTANAVHGAAVNVCNRVFGLDHQCTVRLSRYRLAVLEQSPTVNAQIDQKNNITLFGGLIGRVGSADELAAVLAHEYAHGLMGHVGRKIRNVALGSLVGTAVGAAVGAAVSDERGSASDGARTGEHYGRLAGFRAYSQAMENEADHLGLFILNEAGYDIKAASHFHMRLLNASRSLKNPKQSSTLLYIRTHPGSRERIQKLIGAEKMIETGHLKPIWKQ